jgi:hypothetical protein
MNSRLPEARRIGFGWKARRDEPGRKGTLQQRRAFLDAGRGLICLPNESKLIRELRLLDDETTRIRHAAWWGLRVSLYKRGGARGILRRGPRKMASGLLLETQKTLSIPVVCELLEG